MPDIQVMTSDGEIRRYSFPAHKDNITIGRSKDNDIVLSDRTVSREHAHILRTHDGYLLTDLGSFNGTKVNEDSVQSLLLKKNDQVKIGLNRLTFLIKEEDGFSPADSLLISPEGDKEKQVRLILKSSAPMAPGDSGELLVYTPEAGDDEHIALTIPSKGAENEAEFEADISSLERSNKVLFVLYEISRQLTSIQDFNELLEKIMDLIFMVIDADCGFLVLTGDDKVSDLIPVVVKYRDDQSVERGQLKASRTIIEKVVRDKVALLTSNAMEDPELDHARSIFAQKIRSAMCVPLWRKDKIIGIIQLDSVRFDSQFTEDDLELLKAIGGQMAMIIEQASLNEKVREEERMRGWLEKFLSPQVAEMILEKGLEIMEPKDLTVTILFTDIIGFTHLSEKMPPRDVNMILNEYFHRMTDIVFQYGGTLDKYIGDGLMAVFGAPMEKEDDAYRAIMAAKKMRKELAVMREKTGSRMKLDIRIGINTGRVVAGNIGSPKRMDYTVIGDPVNTASRIESLAEANQILIGEETYRRVKERFNIRKVGPKWVKGKSAEIVVYDIID